MDLFGGLIGYILPFVLVLSVLVFVHELGHYWVARRCGVKVEAFSIGFGPEIFGFNDRAGTRWKFSVLPLGGYVRMFGDGDATSSRSDGRVFTEGERKISFQHQSVGKRAAIVFAGPAANYLFAIVVLAGVFMVYGQPYTPADVGTVQPGSAAEAAGIKPGDLIVEMDGQRIDRFEEIQNIVRLSPGRSLPVVVERDGQRVALEATPTLNNVQDRFGHSYPVGMLGIGRTGMEFRHLDPLSALGAAVGETYTITVGTLQAVGQMIAGSRGTEELGGPLRIAQMSGEVAQTGLISLVWFTAMLSINLGMINLFPVPMLDGGHLVYYAAEALRGRPLGERAQEYGFRIGLALVLTLMVFATWNDLVHLRVVDFFRDLIS